MFNDNRKFVNLQEETWAKLDSVKTNRKFKSLEETTKYLLDLEKSLKENNLIEDRYICTKCDKSISNIESRISEKLHRLKHWQCDHTTDCEGKLRHTYGVKTKTEVLPGTIGTHPGTTVIKDTKTDTKYEQPITEF